MLRLPTRKELATRYVDLVGYDPFEDDPQITDIEVWETLQELELLHDEVAA